LTKFVDAILTSDWHLRDDQPVCRTDNYWEAQASKIDFIKRLQQNHGCPILVAGDIFNEPKPSPYLLAWTIKNLPDKLYVIPGQHDLPGHSIELLNKSGLAVLLEAGKVTLLGEEFPYTFPCRKYPPSSDFEVCGFSWGRKLKLPYFKRGVKHVVLIHTLVGDFNIPDITRAIEILNDLPGVDLVVSGDNHIPFVEEDGGKLLVNPGSMMRMSADQVDHRPRVYLWDAQNNAVDAVYFDVQPGVVSRDHLEKIGGENSHLSAYISRLESNSVGTIDFKANLEAFLRKNKVEEPVKTAIYESMEDQ
jgi:DNA repair exonuclease SbcCD nuclease subunit